MKTRFNRFRRAGVFYTEDTTTGKQANLRTKDETEAKRLLNARNDAQRHGKLASCHHRRFKFRNEIFWGNAAVDRTMNSRFRCTSRFLHCCIRRPAHPERLGHTRSVTGCRAQCKSF